MRDLDVDPRARRLCAVRAIRVAAIAALCAGIGCGDGQERAVVANAPTPTLPRASFSATFAPRATPTPTPQSTAGGGPSTPSQTPASGATVSATLTPVVTLTPSFTPTPAGPGEQHALLRIERAQGFPGTTVTVDVTLLDVDEGVEIAGTQNDISLDGSHVALIENPDGRPDCTVDPEIDKDGASFAFQPPGCGASGSCTGMRALILSLDNTDPIPSGSRLYSCNVSISADAEIGATYALPCSLALASSPSGEAIGVGCDEGAIDVVPILTPGPTPDSEE